MAKNCTAACNIDLLKQNGDYLLNLTKQIDSCVSEDGTISFAYGKGEEALAFLDWQTANTEDALWGMLALIILSAKSAEKLCTILNLDSSAAKNTQRKLCARKISAAKRKSALAMQSLAEQIEKEQAGRLLAKNGAKGMATFMGHSILSAMSDCGRDKEALSIMKEYYGGMLSRGATSFWEDFEIGWLNGSGHIDKLPKTGQKDIHGDFGKHCYVGFRHSLCHGWAGGVAAYLFEKTAGIIILEPGMKKVKLSPNLTYLKEIECDVPTPHGNMNIKYRKSGIKTLIKYSAPKEITIIKDI